MSVVKFTCRIGEKVLHGLVKAKEKAKKIFDQAVAKGESAGLLEQTPESADIFSTKLVGHVMLIICQVWSILWHLNLYTLFNLPSLLRFSAIDHIFPYREVPVSYE